MAIDVEASRIFQKELNIASDDAAMVKRRLMVCQDDVSHSWQAKEAKGIPYALEDLIGRMAWISAELEEIGHLIIVATEELVSEEAAAAASSTDKSGTDYGKDGS